MKHARNFDAAVFWIPAFAGMTSCPRRRASSVRSVWETRYGPCSGSERIMHSLQITLSAWSRLSQELEIELQLLSQPQGTVRVVSHIIPSLRVDEHIQSLTIEH